MAQEFTINSSAIESKINQLLPSQGGFGAGVDFSASTMVIPIVDLTETAEGSDVRVDLQSSFGFVGTNTLYRQGSSSDLITTTGYWRIQGVSNCITSASGIATELILSDGTTNKTFWAHSLPATATFALTSVTFDLIAYIKAGEKVVASSSSSSATLNGSFRQIADIDGNLVNP
jgi:hypothetical protein